MTTPTPLIEREERQRKMPNETITTGLEKYGIGLKLRKLRLRKKLGLTTLAGHTGLSPALLSKLERGQIFPTLPTLLRIAMVYGVGLEYFFNDNVRAPLLEVVRRAERLQLPDTPDGVSPSYFFESLNFPVTQRTMDAYLAAFSADAPASTPHNHPGFELIYVTSGSITLTVGEQQIVLNEGDAAHFDSTTPHNYAATAENGVAMVVTTPA